MNALHAADECDWSLAQAVRISMARWLALVMLGPRDFPLADAAVCQSKRTLRITTSLSRCTMCASTSSSSIEATPTSSAGRRLSSSRDQRSVAIRRTDGVDLVTAANTVVLAIVALEANGFTGTQEADLFIASAGNARFAAEDPVAVLGLVKLAETRRPWRADDAEVSDVLGRFNL